MNKIYNNSCLVNLSEKRFYFHSFVLNGDFYALVSDRESFKPIVRGVNPLMISEVLNGNEVLVLWMVNDKKIKFQHLCFESDKQEVVTKYEKEYTAINKDGEIKFKKNLVIFSEENQSTIYNYKNGKVLVMDKFDLINEELANDDVIGKMDIRSGESIIFNIDNETLEADRFYSVMQDRFVPIVKDRNLDLRLRLMVTLEEEVYPYLERIEEYDEYMRDKKVYRACKKLVKSSK